MQLAPAHTRSRTQTFNLCMSLSGGWGRVEPVDATLQRRLFASKLIGALSLCATKCRYWLERSPWLAAFEAGVGGIMLQNLNVFAD